MPFPRSLRLIVLLWVVAETLVFVGVAEAIGVGGAIVAGFAASLLGAMLLKRSGTSIMLRLRATLAGRAEPARGDVLDAMLRAVAAIALLVPGFLSDAVGLALLVPAVRDAVRRRIGARVVTPRGADPRPRAPGTIDLEPGDWSEGARPPVEHARAEPRSGV